MWHLLEGTAYAMGAPSGGEGLSGLLSGFAPLILVFAIFWFLVIRPQQKRAKEHRNLVANIKKGDEVYTDSGILGTIQRVAENSVTLEIAPKVAIRIQRSRIADLVKESKVKEPKESDDSSAEDDN
jgi:preprotein translocase subunit YajC